MTWAEAKAKSGVGGGGGGKKKAPPKNVSHNQILAQKIITKQQQSSGSSGAETTISRKDLRKAARDDERAAAAIQAAKEERERERLNQKVRPSEQAKERMAELSRKLAESSITSNHHENNKNQWDASDLEKMKQIAECRQIQLDEITALDAIFADTDEFRILQCCRIDEMREKCENYLNDDDNQSLLEAVVKHPDISLSIQLTIDDEGSRNDDGMALVASILLSISLPALYPLYSETPIFKLEDIMITDKNAENSPDKPLESLGFLDEKTLMASLNDEATKLLPDLCVYEVGVGWLTENAFKSFEMRAHAILQT
jgi:hypothetical protein